MKIFKYFFSAPLRARLRLLQKAVVYWFRRQKIRWPVIRGRSLKIIVGAAMTSQKGWYSTNEKWLDITNRNDWKRIFGGRVLLTHVVAEHVFEHLSKDECREALRLINKHMKVGGRLRIAVPDGRHPDSDYIRHVGINGIGADASDHKQLFNEASLALFLEEAGFSVEHLEGYLADGALVQKKIDSNDGYIHRSRSNPLNMAGKAGWGFVDANTSLIIDGIKIS